jgi:rod shape-determining protein MreD
MTGARALRLVVVVLGTLLVQLTVGLDVRVLGVHPDVTVLLPVAAGIVGGPDDGAVVGFVGGLAIDLFLPAPFGLSALVYTLVGYSVGALMSAAEANLAGLDRHPWWLVSLVALTASVVAVMLYAVLGALIGQEQMLKLNLGAIAGVVAVVNALLAVPAVKVMGWALAGHEVADAAAAGGRP